MLYNPFEKDLENVEYEDIQKLIVDKISEGWCIEYKFMLPLLKNGKLDSSKLCKSISAFANTEGGYLIYGVKCDNKNYPVEALGVNIEAFRNIEDQISQVINTNVSPNPFYEVKLLEHSESKPIIIIRVEESPIPPYVTSQGVIYQRESNESKPIKARFILERLNDKANKYYDRIDEFCKFNIGITKGEADSNQSYLELCLYPKPFSSYQINEFDTRETFDNIANTFFSHITTSVDIDDFSEQINIGLGLNSAFRSNNSIIIRRLRSENMIYKSISIEFFRNGSLKLLIPVYDFGVDKMPKSVENSKLIDYLKDVYGYEPVQSPNNFPGGLLSLPNIEMPNLGLSKKVFRDDFKKHVRIIDGSDLIMNIYCVVNIYRQVLRNFNYDFSKRIGLRAKIDNCWRKFVFFENDEYFENIKKYNIPLSPKESIEFPVNSARHNVDLKFDNDATGIVIAKMLLQSVGLPDIEDVGIKQIVRDSFKRFK